MVEFAATVVLFLLVAIGVVETARAIQIYEQVTNAAREGTRYAVVHGPNSPSPVSASDVRNYVIGKAPGLEANSLTVNVSWPADASNSNLTDVVVEVGYPFSPKIPFMPSVLFNFDTASRMVIWPVGGSNGIAP